MNAVETITSFMPYQTSAKENLPQLGAVTVNDNFFTHTLSMQSVTKLGQ